MSCCVEDAVIGQLREIGCSIIREENHFANQRKCEDCYPYVVVSSVQTPGLITSSVIQMDDTITLSAYFRGPADALVMRYRDLVQAWLASPNCLELADCGCFCVRRITRSAITVVQDGVYRYQAVFSGNYRRSESESE